MATTATTSDSATTDAIATVGDHRGSDSGTSHSTIYGETTPKIEAENSDTASAPNLADHCSSNDSPQSGSTDGKPLFLNFTAEFAPCTPPRKTKPRPASFRVNGVNILNRNDVDAKTANERLRRRRENHNFVERRRRDNINQTIQCLAELIPNPSQDQTKMNKGLVLRMAVEYIRELQHINQNLATENARLKAASGAAAAAAAGVGSAIATPSSASTPSLAAVLGPTTTATTAVNSPMPTHSATSTSPSSVLLPPPILSPNAASADPANYHLVPTPCKVSPQIPSSALSSANVSPTTVPLCPPLPAPHQQKQQTSRAFPRPTHARQRSMHEPARYQEYTTFLSAPASPRLTGANGGRNLTNQHHYLHTQQQQQQQQPSLPQQPPPPLSSSRRYNDSNNSHGHPHTSGGASLPPLPSANGFPQQSPHTYTHPPLASSSGGSLPCNGQRYNQPSLGTSQPAPQPLGLGHPPLYHKLSYSGRPTRSVPTSPHLYPERFHPYDPSHAVTPRHTNQYQSAVTAAPYPQRGPTNLSPSAPSHHQTHHHSHHHQDLRP